MHFSYRFIAVGVAYIGCGVAVQHFDIEIIEKDRKIQLYKFSDRIAAHGEVQYHAASWDGVVSHRQCFRKGIKSILQHKRGERAC